MHIHEGRTVVTWTPEGVPRGCITGLQHYAPVRGFEVDWIIRFPGTLAGDGERMVADLLPKLVAELGLRWVLVKIRDDYHPERLAAMAARFGFVHQQRDGAVDYWRKDIL